MVYHHPDKFTDHRDCDRGDLIIVTSRDYVFKRLCDFMGGNSSGPHQVTTLSCLVVSGLVQVKI